MDIKTSTRKSSRGNRNAFFFVDKNYDIKFVYFSVKKNDVVEALNAWHESLKQFNALPS